MHILALCTADTPVTVGRFNVGSIPDQDLMELLIQCTADSDKRSFQDRDGQYHPIISWRGVETEIRNGRDRVTQIYLPSNMTGTLCFEFIPHEVVHFEAPKTEMRGEVDLTCLPPTLKRFIIGFNAFTGSCDLTRLPPALELLDVHFNKLSGSVSLDYLPETLAELFIDHNRLVGELSFANLPESLHTLLLSGNAFCGSFVLHTETENLRLFAKHTKFSGVAIVDGPQSIDVRLDGVAVTAVVDGSGRPHPREREICPHLRC